MFLNFEFSVSSMEKKSVDKLVEASAAEVEAVRTVWQAAQAASSSPPDESPLSQGSSPITDTLSDGSDTDGDVRLHPRAVCTFTSLCFDCPFGFPVLNLWLAQVVVAKETVGNLGGMVRQLSLDQFENESRRMIPVADQSTLGKKFTRSKSPQGLHKKVGLTNR